MTPVTKRVRFRPDKWILAMEIETRYLRAAPNVVKGAAIIFSQGAFNGE
jgi:hypothetical protein